MTPDEISHLAYLLYPDIVGPKPDKTSTESLASRIKALQKGLLPEDEFAATICWLGNSATAHRLCQSPMPYPALAEVMRAPDFIAFPMVGDKPLPILIEVKSCHEPHLDWSEKYLNSLRRFANCLNLPVLVAWKCGYLWTLVDLQHFEKNVTGYRLTMEKAIREDLFCLLFRNLRIEMNSEIELTFRMEILDSLVGGTDALLPEGNFNMKIVGAGFYRQGTPVNDAPPYFSTLFLAAPDEAELRRIGKQECEQVFRPLPDHCFSLSNVLVAWQSLRSKDESIDWHRVLSASEFPPSGREFRAWLPVAIEKGFVRYVFDILPNTWPTFLPEKKEWETIRKSRKEDI